MKYAKSPLFKKIALKGLGLGVLFLSLTSQAATKVEESYPLKFGEVETVVQQLLLTGDNFVSRVFYIPAAIEKESKMTATQGDAEANAEAVIHPVKDTQNAPVIFIPDIARGGIVTDDLKGYLRDFSTYIPAILGSRDIYIYPGRVVEGAYIHNCGLIVSNWVSEFTNWSSTKQGVSRCIEQLKQFNFDMSAFSTEKIAKDLAIFIKDEQLQKPIIWALGGQYDIANKLAADMGKDLGGLVLDNPDISNRIDGQNAFSEYLERVDALALDKDRGWTSDKKPSELLNAMITSSNAGEVYEGTVSDIGYNEDINRIFPVNGDVLNYYMLAKVDQPQFLADLAAGDEKAIYRQFGPFSLESYGAVSSFPERYRSCEDTNSLDISIAPENLKETFERDMKRQQAICEALGVSTAAKKAAKNINVPTSIIVSGMNPYYSSTSTQAWIKENYKNATLVNIIDGSLGTPECTGQPLANMVKDIAQNFNDGKFSNKEFQCGWHFETSSEVQAQLESQAQQPQATE
ncbi:MAG: hypothetical protein ACK5MJ_04450 [Alphaproteobacteria bacterium]